MTDGAKAAARKAAFVRRKGAFEAQHPGAAGHLAEVLAGYRGVPLAGYMAIRTEIDPLAVMAEAAAHGPVGVPVIMGAISLSFRTSLLQRNLQSVLPHRSDQLRWKLCRYSNRSRPLWTLRPSLFFGSSLLQWKLSGLLCCRTNQLLG